MIRIGPYTVLSELGRGGMGIVYTAQDPAGRKVALKVLPRDKASMLAQRFEREIETLAGFSHPNVVRVHAAGHADDVAYYAMDLASGGSLSERVARQGPYSPEAATRLVEALAGAMAAAHAHGVLHRDLKPDNVLFDDREQPLVSDFGLARQLYDSDALTQSGHMLGSPGYMAPEQVRGERDAQGQRTDVYGLGATLYFTLTGQAPFEGDELAYLVQATLEDRPIPPSSLNPSVPKALDQLCLRCLEKSPADRYPSMDALRADLQAFLAGNLRATNRQHLAWAVASAFLALCATGGVLWLWFGRATPPPAPTSAPASDRPTAPDPPPTAPPDLQPERRPPLRVGWNLAAQQARRFSDEHDLDEAIRHFDHARERAPEDEVFLLEKERLLVYTRRMELRWAAGRFADARADCDLILEVSEPVAEAARGDRAPLQAGLKDFALAAELQVPNGKAHAMRMRLLTAEGLLEEALREGQLALSVMRTHWVIHAQAWLRYRLGDPEQAQAEARECCLSFEELPALINHEPRGFLLLATIAREQGDEARAQELLQGVAQSLYPYGAHEASVLLVPGRRAELRGALDAAREQPEQSASYWVRVGRLAWDCREIEEAEQAFLRAIDLEPEHREALEAWTDLCLELRRWPRALELGRQLAKLEGARAAGLSRAALALSALYRYPESLEAARAALELDPRLRLSETCGILAKALGATGQPEDALRTLAPLIESDDLRLQGFATRARAAIDGFSSSRKAIKVLDPRRGK